MVALPGLQAFNDPWHGEQADGETDGEGMQHGILAPVRVSIAQKSLPATVHDGPGDHQSSDQQPDRIELHHDPLLVTSVFRMTEVTIELVFREFVATECSSFWSYHTDSQLVS